MMVTDESMLKYLSDFALSSLSLRLDTGRGHLNTTELFALQWLAHRSLSMFQRLTMRLKYYRRLLGRPLLRGFLSVLKMDTHLPISVYGRRQSFESLPR